LFVALKNISLFQWRGNNFWTEKGVENIKYEYNAAFTISGFDDQERNLSFVKTAIQV